MPLPTTSREKDSYAAFVFNGFSNWKKALDRFSTHERSELHKAAVLGLSVASKGTPISSHLSAQRQREMNDARYSLSMIFSYYNKYAYLSTVDNNLYTTAVRFISAHNQK